MESTEQAPLSSVYHTEGVPLNDDVFSNNESNAFEKQQTSTLQIQSRPANKVPLSRGIPLETIHIDEALKPQDVRYFAQPSTSTIQQQQTSYVVNKMDIFHPLTIEQKPGISGTVRKFADQMNILSKPIVKSGVVTDSQSRTYFDWYILSVLGAFCFCPIGMCANYYAIRSNYGHDFNIGEHKIYSYRTYAKVLTILSIIIGSIALFAMIISIVVAINNRPKVSGSGSYGYNSY